jgi:hypothetical protein
MVFNRADELVGEVPLKHSATYLYPYSENSVLVAGTCPQPNLTMYTIITFTKGKLDAKLKTIPMEAWANRWLGTIDGKEYFSDPGGNSADTSTDLSLPARLRLPVGGTAIGKKLFVLQKEDMFNPKSNLAIVDVTTGKHTLAFPTSRGNVASLVKIPGTTQIAISERAANQWILYDTAGAKLLGEFHTLGSEPRGIAALGNCIVVGSFGNRGIEVFKKSGDTYASAGEIAMDLPVEEFEILTQIAADAKTGRVYGRSNAACNPISAECVNDINRVVVWDSELLTACR